MNRFMPLLIVIAAVIAGCAPDRSDEIARLNAEVARLREISGPAPASLDSLYPPIAQAPLWKLAMFEMSTPLTGVMLRLSENDPAGAKQYFDRFRAAYEKTSALAPEWKGSFPAAPVQELASAMEGGGMESIIGAMGKVGKVCHDCHVVNLPKVQYARYWGDFSVISVTDPVSKRDMKFNEFMMGLDMSFTGMAIELGEGRVEKARERFAAFNAGMGLLRETCGACHDTERAYFVDKSVQASIDALGLALNNRTPDPKLIGELSMRIGMESCGKCHLVHVPAAYAQARAREWNAAALETPAETGAK